MPTKVLNSTFCLIMLTQVSVYAIKRVNFGLKYQCFTEKKGSFLAEKSVFCHEKETNFQTGEQG